MAAATSPTFVEQARRAQIIGATIEVIAEFGYAGASIARIAQRAGISVGLVSYHFGSKHELLRQVAVHLGDRIGAAITSATEHAESYADALRSLIESHVTFTGADTVEASALSQIYLSGADASPVRPSADERRAWIDEISDMIRQGQDVGEFRRCDPHPVAVAILAALEASPTEVRSRADTDLDHYAAELADLFVTALLPRR